MGTMIDESMEQITMCNAMLFVEFWGHLSAAI